jgi:hypothetical protein
MVKVWKGLGFLFPGTRPKAGPGQKRRPKTFSKNFASSYSFLAKDSDFRLRGGKQVSWLGVITLLAFPACASGCFELLPHSGGTAADFHRSSLNFPKQSKSAFTNAVKEKIR